MGMEHLSLSFIVQRIRSFAEDHRVQLRNDFDAELDRRLYGYKRMDAERIDLSICSLYALVLMYKENGVENPKELIKAEIDYRLYGEDS